MVTPISCSLSSIPKLNTITEVTAATCFLRLYTFIRIQTCKQITCDRFILWTWSVPATAITTSCGSQVSVISRIYIKPTHNRLNISLVQLFSRKSQQRVDCSTPRRTWLSWRSAVNTPGGTSSSGLSCRIDNRWPITFGPWSVCSTSVTKHEKVLLECQKNKQKYNNNDWY